MRPPVILITCDVDEVAAQPSETLLRLRFNYASAIARAGGLPLILPPVRQQFEGFLSAEGLGSVIMEARCENAIGNRLGVDVGEVLGGDVVDKVFFERHVLPCQFAPHVRVWDGFL